jgi:hypothetical protein
MAGAEENDDGGKAPGPGIGARLFLVVMLVLFGGTIALLVWATL